MIASILWALSLGQAPASQTNWPLAELAYEAAHNLDLDLLRTFLKKDPSVAKVTLGQINSHRPDDIRKELNIKDERTILAAIVGGDVDWGNFSHEGKGPDTAGGRDAMIDIVDALLDSGADINWHHEGRPPFGDTSVPKPLTLDLLDQVAPYRDFGNAYTPGQDYSWPLYKHLVEKGLAPTKFDSARRTFGFFLDDRWEERRKYLFDHGLDLKKRDVGGLTPLMQRLYWDTFTNTPNQTFPSTGKEIVKRYVKYGSDIEAHFPTGESPFIFARNMLKRYGEWEDTVWGCLDAGCNPNELDSAGETFMFYFARNGSFDMSDRVKTLVEHYHMDYKIKNRDGLTVEDVAIKHNQMNTVKYLESRT